MEMNMTLAVAGYPREATIFASVCAILFVIVGVIGNAITSAALLAYPKLRGHATTTFVLSLCVSDLLFCATSLPPTAARYLQQRWTFGGALCQVFPVMFYGNVAVSLLSMVAITVNRYVLIAYYDLYSSIYTTTKIWIQLILIWGISFGLLIPPLLGVWGQIGLDPNTFSCTILPKDGRSPKKFMFVFGFALPCIVIIVSYSCIYWKVRQSKRKLESRSKISSTTAREKEEDSRLTTLMLTIFISFLACFLPLSIMNVAFESGGAGPAWLHVLASVLAWAAAVVNPLIYVATSRQYRAAYKHLLRLALPQHVRGSRTSHSAHAHYSDKRHSNKIFSEKPISI